MRIDIRAAVLGIVVLSLSMHAFAKEPVVVNVGDRVISGGKIRNYFDGWDQYLSQDDQWSQRGGVSEKLELLEEGGSRYLQRTQTAEGALGGLGYVTRVRMKPDTLAPVSFDWSLPDEVPAETQEKLVQRGLQHRRVFLDFDKKTLSKTGFDGQTSVEPLNVSSPVFEGSVLGLLLAALPLEAGYSATLPLISTSPTGQITPYWIIARVEGTKKIDRPGGKPARAWIVEVDWADFDTGEITSRGGADKAGGAYWVIPDPPPDLPHVPKYINESVDYRLRPRPG